MKKTIWIIIACTLVLLLSGAIFYIVFNMLPAQKTADKALSYFLAKDYDKLYELNHSVIKKTVTREQIKAYVDNTVPSDVKDFKSIKGFLVGKFVDYGYPCLIFEIELKFENRTSVARVSVARDGEKWSILHFSYFPNIERKQLISK